MEQVGRRTPVRAVARSVARPRRPFPQQGNPPGSENARTCGRSVMNEEHDGTDQGKPSEEEYQRFRRMMDGVGREGLQRMVEHLTERIDANPRDTEALGGRGLAYGELGEHRRAAEDYGRIIALDPANPGAYLGRARAYGRLEEHRLAVEDYDIAIRLAPGDAVAHYGRGACKAELGDLAGAMSDFDVAVTLAPRRRRRSLQQGIDPGGDGKAPPGGEGPEQGHRFEPQSRRRPLPPGHGLPRHGPDGQGAQGLRRRRRDRREVRPRLLRQGDHQSQSWSTRGRAGRL